MKINSRITSNRQRSHFSCLILGCAVLTTLFCGCQKKPQNVHVTGRIYVITKGQTVIPMPAVDVMVFRKDLMQIAIEKCNAELSKARPDYLKKIHDAIVNDAASSNRIVKLIKDEDAKVEQLAPLIEKGQAIEKSQADKVYEIEQSVNTFGFNILSAHSNQCNEDFEDYKRQKADTSASGEDVQKAYAKYLNSARTYKSLVATLNKNKEPVVVNGISLAQLKEKMASISHAKDELSVKLNAINGASETENAWESFTKEIAIQDIVPATIKTTDSGGNFEFTFRTNGVYIFIATSERAVGDEPEKYFWVSAHNFIDYGEFKIEINNNDDLRQKGLQRDLTVYQLDGERAKTYTRLENERGSDFYFLDIFKSYGLDTSLGQ